MKKKILAMVAASMMLMAALTGCGGSTESVAEYSEDNLLSADETDELYSNPDDYIGKSVNLYGQIFNDMGSEDGTVCFQIFTDPSNAEDDVVVYYENADYQVKTDAYVLVKGVVTDSFTGENAFGGETTCPTIKATSVEESNYIDAVSPTLASFDIGQTKSIAGLDITIEKVEFAEKETRVYTSITNTTSTSADFYGNISTLVQGGKQYEFEYNYDDAYEEVPDVVNAGVTVTGILTYPAAEQADFKLVFSGSVGDNYLEDEEIPVTISNAS